MQFFAFFSPKWYIFPQYSFNKMSNVILDLDSIWVSIFTLTVISLFSKEITVHILGSFGGTKYMETGIKYVKE